MIVLTSKYPSQSAADAVNYPLAGKARNVVASGDGTGTPLEKDWLNDLFGWQQALMAAVGLAPNGTPETQISSQLLSAMRLLLLQKTIAVYDITPSTAEATNSPYPLTLNYQFGGFSVSGNLVTVPAAGKYRVKFDGAAQSSSATNPSPIAAQISVGGSNIKFATATRSSTTTSEAASLSCEGIATVVTPASDTIGVTAIYNTVSFQGSGGILILERLS